MARSKPWLTASKDGTGGVSLKQSVIKSKGGVGGNAVRPTVDHQGFGVMDRVAGVQDPLIQSHLLLPDS
jgi:hypothetical protein